MGDMIGDWLVWFYSTSVSVPLSIGVILAMLVTIRTRHGRGVVLGLSVFLYTRYLVWRGVYSLNTDTLVSSIISWTVYLAEGYGFLQFIFFASQAWSPTSRTSPPLRRYPTVDIFIPVVKEPLEILKRTLVGCLSQDYPKDKFEVYVLDDGQRDDVKALAERWGCNYLRRPQRTCAKAGNLNHALAHSSGELVAIFDVDHVPVQSFLKETVGFFEDQQVAVVQTPQHFYNPDIFQKNLRLGEELKNEQDLFFRTLEAGRDAHNSAFFAGSCGVLRRGPLMEIGGFKTETLTEDLHTSLILHAKGYKSCYLNKVLAAGLMPESFQSHLKQRSRWTMGAVKMLFVSNPLTIPGLTVIQRLDYFASSFYFLNGFPRIVWLTAPLSALLFGIAPFYGGTLEFTNLFASSYLGCILVVQLMGRGTRNAFWSDVFDVAVAFTQFAALIKVLTNAWKRESFVVTPKGENIKKPGFQELGVMVPHLVLFGLILTGLISGLTQLAGEAWTPGLAVNLFWASFNILMLSVVMLTAMEKPQKRQLHRIRRHFPCELTAGAASVNAITQDISETGMRVRLTKPLMVNHEDVTVSFWLQSGSCLSFKARMLRQDWNQDRLEAGIQFLEEDEKRTQEVIRLMFSLPESWRDSSTPASGIIQSLAALFKVFPRKMWRDWLPRRRWPRAELQKECILLWQGKKLPAITCDISYGGISVVLASVPRITQQSCVVELDEIALNVRPIAIVRHVLGSTIRFRVESVEKGHKLWRDLNLTAYRRSVMPPALRASAMS